MFYRPLHRIERIYPDLPADNFRLTEISRIEKEISDEVEHYRLVLKKYKKARKAVHYSAVGLSAVAAAVFWGFAASLTGVGVVVGAPVAGVAASTVFASTSLTVLNKKLDLKVDKHSRLLSLATAKHDSINSCVSQAMNDNHISDKGFQLITREMQKNRHLKETFRSHFKPAAPPQPDLEKIKDQIRQEFRKKLVESSANLIKILCPKNTTFSLSFTAN